ncbi:chemotaxis protein CheW [Sporomusa acidovorans]|uniref:chemotaxis protein CheW n=1 Tax=Sporomusa acidovorans TaxID=112900 RepID=UPI00088E7C6D|nr:chemotaxis protein CheW [Sporomusa acidovorans]OZC14783.1 chemotaxis protein CheW [Sporomusa acidovorans DSM 3132]SDF71261.1 purine-binding chemotaxis protein CheW [Sporomusa acidovorans]
MATIQLVVFELAGNEYGIDSLAVNGILRSKKFKIQKIPGMIAAIEGIINLRGKINYIFNLRTKFGIEDTKIAEESKFVMLNIGKFVAGCIVDEVTDIIKYETADIQMPPSFAQNLGTAYIKGIAKVDDRIIILLNPEKIISMEECERVDTALPFLPIETAIA